MSTGRQPIVIWVVLEAYEEGFDCSECFSSATYSHIFCGAHLEKWQAHERIADLLRRRPNSTFTIEREEIR